MQARLPTVRHCDSQTRGKSQEQQRTGATGRHLAAGTLHVALTPPLQRPAQWNAGSPGHHAQLKPWRTRPRSPCRGRTSWSAAGGRRRRHTTQAPVPPAALQPQAQGSVRRGRGLRQGQESRSLRGCGWRRRNPNGPDLSPAVGSSAQARGHAGSSCCSAAATAAPAACLAQRPMHKRNTHAGDAVIQLPCLWALPWPQECQHSTHSAAVSPPDAQKHQTGHCDTAHKRAHDM